jgi:flagellar basal body P-ring formation protein FlgA
MRTAAVRVALVAVLAALAAAPAAAQESGPTHNQEAVPADGRVTVPVARHDLPRGAVLSADDIELRVAAATRSAADYASAGWLTRRVIKAGEELRGPAVTRPEVVRRGEAVELTTTTGPVVLTLAGTALGGGGMGERINVRIARGWTVEGVVVGPSQVALRNELRPR